MKKYTLEQLKESESTFMKFIIQEHENDGDIGNYKKAKEYYFKNSVGKKNPAPSQFNRHLKVFAFCTKEYL